MEDESDDVPNCSWCSWNGLQKLGWLREDYSLKKKKKKKQQQKKTKNKKTFPATIDR